jgi:hypothetical protein
VNKRKSTSGPFPGDLYHSSVHGSWIFVLSVSADRHELTYMWYGKGGARNLYSIDPMKEEDMYRRDHELWVRQYDKKVDAAWARQAGAGDADQADTVKQADTATSEGPTFTKPWPLCLTPDWVGPFR